MAKLTLIAIAASSILLVAPVVSSAIELATEIHSLMFKEVVIKFNHVRTLILY